MKPEYEEEAKLCYMDKYSVTVHVPTEDIYGDIAKDVEARFDTSHYKLDWRLPKGKNKKVIDVMKDELGWKILKEFIGLRAKTYSWRQ